MIERLRDGMRYGLAFELRDWFDSCTANNGAEGKNGRDGVGEGFVTMQWTW